MPCSSDHMNPSGTELESSRVCKFLVYVNELHDRFTASWIKKAATDYYGNVARLDEATALLCEKIRCMTKNDREFIIYNAHSVESRRLADWWERHKEWDERRVNEEEKTRNKVVTRDRALKKLTVEEMKALDLV